MTNANKERMLKTASAMVSDDYRSRFCAEYIQLKVRVEGLTSLLNNWDNLDFVPKTPKEILQHQLGVMNDYLATLEYRASVEDIELPEVRSEDDE